MKKTMIPLLAVLCMLSVISCKKSADLSSNSNAVAPGFPGANMTNSFPSGITVSVPLGGNIQHAIDSVATAGGGTVNLASGTYTITATLKIKSGVTLSGVGTPNTTITGGNFNIIENATEGLSNVTIQNLKITGTKSINCYGILIQAGTNFHHNVIVQNVQITSVGMGAHFKRVIGLTVTNCNIHDNAGPGMEDYFHNLYIRSCTNVNVTTTQTNNSTTGNGMNFSYDTTVVVSGCTANNNYFRGIRAADCVGFTAKNCAIGGNTDIGLIMNSEVHATTNIDLDSNTVTNNLAGGIKVISGCTGKVINNTSTGNTSYNYQIASGITQSNNH